jgi:hypothetical protein
MTLRRRWKADLIPFAGCPTKFVLYPFPLAKPGSFRKQESAAPMTVSTNETDLTKINRAIQQLEQGRLNVAGVCSLAAGASATTVKAPNCGAASQVFLTAKTANAAAALATTYVSAVANGSFTLAHASNAQTDRTFGFACLG